MKFKYSILLLTGILLSINACKNAEPPIITYQTVKSILDNNCAISGCHNTTTAQDSVNYTSYATMTDTVNYINTLHKFNNGFRDRVIVQKNMPPSGPLSQDDLDLLQAWIDNDYAEN